MSQLPLYISLLFVLTTALTVFFFYKATHFSKQSLIVIVAWLAITGLIAMSGFFKITNTIPPRFIVLVAPPLLLISTIFFTQQGRCFIDQLSLKTLTLLHVVRIPVELILFFLYQHKAVP